MFGLGTLINTVSIVAGGIIGLILKNSLSKKFHKTILDAMAIATIFLGISGCLTNLMVVKGDQLQAPKLLLLFVSLALGAVIGETIDIDDKIDRFGYWLKHKSHNDKDSQFMDGFLTATLTVCIGAMAVTGALNDGLFGNIDILISKSFLDFVFVLIMTASISKGALFSFIPVFIFQMTLTLMAKMIAPYLSVAAVSNLSMVGGALITAIGFNLLFKDNVQIKVSNLLPALIIAVIFTNII